MAGIQDAFDEVDKDKDGTLPPPENALVPTTEDPIQALQESASGGTAIWQKNADQLKAESDLQNRDTLSIYEAYGAQEIVGIAKDAEGNEIPGGVIIVNADGEEEVINPRQDLEESGFDPDDFNVHTNSPNLPKQEVPPSMSATEGGVQGLGTVRGIRDSLKGRFEDVTINREGEVVVLDGDTWYTVNPEWMGSGDAYQMSRALLQDLAHFGAQEGPIVGGILVGGAVAATALTGGAAAPSIPVAMAAAGVGGAGGAFVRNSMGRVAGTYEATPEEEAFDLGMTGLFAAGGEGLILGAKASYPAIKNGLSAATEKIAKASEPVYNALTEFYGGLTGAGAAATRTMVNSKGGTTAVIRELESAVGRSNVSGIQSLARDKAIGAADSLLQDAESALPILYGRNLERVAAEGQDRALEANIPEMLREVQSSFVEAGLGTFERSQTSIAVSFKEAKAEAQKAVRVGLDDIKGIKDNLKKVQTQNKLLAKKSSIFGDNLFRGDEQVLEKQLASKINQVQALRLNAANIKPQPAGPVRGRDGRVIEDVDFRQLNPEEIAARMQPVTGEPLPVKILSDTTFAQVKSLANTIKSFSQLAPAKGGNAVELMNTINAQLNSILKNVDRTASPAEWQAMSNATKAFRVSVDRTMEKAGLDKSWSTLRDSYKQYGDAVGIARKLKDGDKGAESFLNHVVDKSPTAHRTEKRLKDKMVELVDAAHGGNRGTDLADVVANMYAAERFAPLAPHWTAAGARAEVAVGAGVLTGGVVSSGVGGPAGGMLVAGALSQSSPAIVRKQIDAGWKVLEFLQRAGKAGDGAIDTVLRDPQYMRTITAEFATSEENARQVEQAIVETKLQKAAAKEQMKLKLEEQALKIEAEFKAREASVKDDK